MSTFKLQIEDRETGEILTNHFLEENDLAEFAEYIAEDTICTLEIIDLETFDPYAD